VNTVMMALHLFFEAIISLWFDIYGHN